jgi:hypothetical protein
MHERVAMFQLVVCSTAADPTCLNGKAACTRDVPRCHAYAQPAKKPIDENPAG